jgi:hypothetical protein
MKSPFRFLFLHKLTAAFVLAAALFFSAATALRADDDCQRRIIRADHKIHQAAQRHGWDSPQVAKYRLELAAARTFCWDHSHRWWNEDDRRWHTERDWDDHDHDHDRDHDHDHH